MNKIIEVNKVIKLVKLVSQIVLESGGETYRAEETCKYICKSLGAEEVDSFALPTGMYFTVSFDGVTERTVVKRIKKRSVNLANIDMVNSISRNLTNGNIEIDEALFMLEKLSVEKEEKQTVLSTCYGGLSAAFFTLLFGGGINEFAIAFFSGVLVTLCTRRFYKLDSYQFLVAFTGGLIISFSAVFGAAINTSVNYQNVIVGGMMPLFPGLAMTNAIRDTLRGDLVSGIARGAEALLVATSLAIGAGAAISIASYVGMFIF